MPNNDNVDTVNTMRYLIQTWIFLFSLLMRKKDRKEGEKGRRKGGREAKKDNLCYLLSIFFLVRITKSAPQIPSVIFIRAVLDCYLRVNLYTKPKQKLVRISISVTDMKSWKLKVFLFSYVAVLQLEFGWNYCTMNSLSVTQYLKCS